MRLQVIRHGQNNVNSRISGDIIDISAETVTLVQVVGHDYMGG